MSGDPNETKSDGSNGVSSTSNSITAPTVNATGTKKKPDEQRDDFHADDLAFTLCLYSAGGGGADGEAMLACCVVIVFVALAAAIATAATTMASAFYRTLKRSDDTSADRVVEFLEKLNQASNTDRQKKSVADKFVANLRESHHTGLFSTSASKNFDLRRECCGPDASTKAGKATLPNLIRYLKKPGTFAKHTNNGRNLFNRTVFKGLGEIVIQEKITNMQPQQQCLLINTIIDKYKSAGCWSSDRSKELFLSLQKSETPQVDKIESIIAFIRGTDKKQRMYQAIMDACDDVINSANTKDERCKM